MHFSEGRLPFLFNPGYMSTVEYVFTQVYINIFTFVSGHKIAERKTMSLTSLTF